MKNTERYFKTIKEFRSAMRELERLYQEKLKQIEPYKGSRGYDEGKSELDKARSEDLDGIRKEYRSQLNGIISDMETVYKNQPIKAPTAEQLALIQVLKMRERVSMDELRRAANTCKDCPLALEAVREIAHKCGVPLGVDPEISGDAVAQNLRTLKSHTSQMFGMDKVDNRRGHLERDRYDLFLMDRDAEDEFDCLGIMGLTCDKEKFAKMVNEAK